MGLIRERVAQNGVPLCYHRVVSVTQITNHSTTVEVASYVSKAKREDEARALAHGEPMDVYIGTEFVELPYDPQMDVDKAYAWLKSRPGWEDAVDDGDAVGLSAEGEDR